MSEDNQIFEMAKLITEGARPAVEDADALYNAGFRKASEVAREVLDEIFLRIREEFSLSELGKSALSAMEAELKKKYTEGGK